MPCGPDLQPQQLPLQLLPPGCPTSAPRVPTIRSDNTWTFNSCEFADFDGWADAANARLRAQGVPVDTYKYK